MRHRNPINNFHSFLIEGLRRAIATPPAGREWVCSTCGEVCAVEKMDIGPYEGREVYYDWRTDCCSGHYEDREMEEAP